MWQEFIVKFRPKYYQQDRAQLHLASKQSELQ